MSTHKPSTAQTPSAHTRLWVERLVVGENLCPFARPVMDTLKIVESQGEHIEPITLDFLALLDEVQSSDDALIPTALLVIAKALGDFEDYLDWLSMCEELLIEAGLEGVIQLAGFHPQYVFADEDAEDLSHYTNRSPFPMIHLIREAHINDALSTVTRPEAIPERNKRHISRLGRQGLLNLMPELANSAIFNDQ